MSAVAKGVVIGVATGCLTALAVAKGCGMKKCNKKKAEHAVKTIRNAIQDIVNMVK